MHCTPYLPWLFLLVQGLLVVLALTCAVASWRIRAAHRNELTRLEELKFDLNLRGAREQQLVNACFSLVRQVTDLERRTWLLQTTRDQRMTWAANRLRDLGFDTVPQGSSYGVLKKPLGMTPEERKGR